MDDNIFKSMDKSMDKSMMAAGTGGGRN